MEKKRALLVFPDYNKVHGFSERQLFVLQQAGVLPPSLGKYASLGASADREKLFSILSSDFVVNVLRGEVTASDFNIALRRQNIRNSKRATRKMSEMPVHIASKQSARVKSRNVALACPHSF